MSAMKPLLFPEPAVAVIPEDIVTTTASAFRVHYRADMPQSWSCRLTQNHLLHVLAARRQTVAAEKAVDEQSFTSTFSVIAKRAHRLNGFVSTRVPCPGCQLLFRTRA